MIQSAPNRYSLGPALSGALWTALCLVGGLVAGIGIGNLVDSGLSGHASDPVRTALAAALAVSSLVLASALWGRSMGRVAGSPASHRMAGAGILGFVPVTVVLSVVLLLIEPVALRLWGEWLPVHRLYTLLFVPTAFLITATMSFVIGREVGDTARARGLALRAGLAGAAAFLVVNLIMEALGWVVGAPGAAERFTMLSVTFLGDTGAALAAGAILGAQLEANERGRTAIHTQP